MATQTQRVNKSFNTEENDFKGLQEEDKKIKTRNFRILMGGIISALVIGSSAYVIAKEPSEWAPWVQTLTAAQAKKPDMVAKITEQKVKLEGLYSVNKKGIVDLQKYKEVAIVLKKAPEQIVAFYDQNERMYKASSKDLTSDQKIIEGLFAIPVLEMAAKTDKKVEADLKTAKKTYLSKEAMQLATSYQTTPPNRIAGMEILSKNITEKTKDLEAAYNTIVAEVANKLKSGSFDLNAGEKVFMQAASEEINSTKSQIDNAKKDLDEGEYNELLKSNEAAYTQVASSVAADKKKVEDLVKKYGANNVQVQPGTNGAGQTIVVQEQRGMGFMDYWLISQWMNTSSSAANYGSGYAAGVAANKTGAGLGSAAYNTPTKVAPTAASIASAQGAQKGYSNLYSVNNPDSPVAKRLAAADAAKNPAGAKTSYSFNQKIAEKRNAAVTRKAEAVKASARAAEARSAAARSNSSKSSSSGFGRSGSGMSGGG